ncbi:unnamed protein product [Gongylonema pulchrum]|uniref:Uncharacterized protein n=1 Tax=Gongylonema pulchrum TaxID=637853 RepID=A0A3P7PF25_9BILA|nr:unnamed protein product [Gongylonema pulchrum]
MITSWRVQCVSKCLLGRFLTGFCCKLCTTPVEVPDRCVRCDLVLNQWYHCYRFTCPVLNCPISQHVKNPKREHEFDRSASIAMQISQNSLSGARHVSCRSMYTLFLSAWRNYLPEVRMPNERM